MCELTPELVCGKFLAKVEQRHLDILHPPTPTTISHKNILIRPHVKILFPVLLHPLVEVKSGKYGTMCVSTSVGWARPMVMTAAQLYYDHMQTPDVNYRDKLN